MGNVPGKMGDVPFQRIVINGAIPRNYLKVETHTADEIGTDLFAPTSSGRPAGGYAGGVAL
jgi:hypothetical protein